MNPLFLILKNLLLTVLIEGALMLIFTKSKTKIYHSVLVNAVTNPLINLFLIFWANFLSKPDLTGYYAVVAVLEVAVVLTEWVLYYKMGDFLSKKAFFASLGLNAASFFIGLFL